MVASSPAGPWALPGLRQRRVGQGPRPGAAAGPHSCLAPPHVPVPTLDPMGTPGPALTCLIVVIDLHLSWLQALHQDVPLHREGEAEGLAAQLGKGSGGGSGVASHRPGLPQASALPRAPSLSSASWARTLVGVGAVGLAEGQGQGLGPFPTLGEALVGGEVRARSVHGAKGKRAECCEESASKSERSAKVSI